MLQGWCLLFHAEIGIIITVPAPAAIRASIATLSLLLFTIDIPDVERKNFLCSIPVDKKVPLWQKYPLILPIHSVITLPLRQ